MIASLPNRISRLLLHVSDTVDMNSPWNALTCDYFPIRKQSKWSQGRLSTSVSNAPTRVAQWAPIPSQSLPRSQGSSTTNTLRQLAVFFKRIPLLFWRLKLRIGLRGVTFIFEMLYILCCSDEPCSEQPELGLCYETLLTTDEQCGKSLTNPVTMEQCCSTVLWFCCFDFFLNLNYFLTNHWLFIRLEKHGDRTVSYARSRLLHKSHGHTVR